MLYNQSFFRSSGHAMTPVRLDLLSFYTMSDVEAFCVGDILRGVDDKLYKLVKLQWTTDNIFEVTLLPEEEPQQ